MKNIRIEPGKTSLRMYAVIVDGKRPVLKHAHVDAEEGEEELTPAQARFAFRKKWVAEKWIKAMTRIALSDGKDYYPPNED